jgi:tetrapyrrole methylase family protein/MazG family protein
MPTAVGTGHPDASGLRPEVVVIGLGPGPAELLTEPARRLWERFAPDARFVRTARHPAVAALGAHRSFDETYEQATTLEDVYPAIVERLVAEAAARGRVAYAVPGSPLVAERTVELLRGEGRVQLRVEPALSFLDLAWARLGVDPLAAGVRLVDGQRFTVEAAGASGPLLVGQCDSIDVLSAIKLSVDDAPAEPVVVLQRLGLPDESVSAVGWAELDRAVQPDHLTSLWIPRLAPAVGAELVGFWELVRTLREQCPWDRAQTPHSLRRYLLEESYEVLDALDRLDPDDGAGAEDVADELGDLLFQVVFHSVIAQERGWFTLADVAAGINEKLVRRHPHVFGETAAGDVGTVVRNWDEIKRRERAEKLAAEPGAPGVRPGPFDGVAAALPALAYAAKLQRRARGAGHQPDAELEVRLQAGLVAAGAVLAGAEPSAEQLGDALFALVALSRSSGADPEEALREAANRFRAAVETGPEVAPPPR